MSLLSPRLKALPSFSTTRDVFAFFLIGLLNNYPYCVMIASSQFIFEGFTGAVLLANILPAVLIKLTAPFFMHHIPFNTRILFITLVSFLSFILVAWGHYVQVKLFGVILAAIGSGLGEITFLAMMSYYHPNCVSAWSAGTGMAGIAGSLSFLLLNAIMGIPPSWTLMISDTIVPLMLVATFGILTGRHNVGRALWGFGWRVKGKEPREVEATGFEGYEVDEVEQEEIGLGDSFNHGQSPVSGENIHESRTLTNGTTYGATAASSSLKPFQQASFKTAHTPNSVSGDTSETDSLLQKTDAPAYSELDEESLSAPIFKTSTEFPQTEQDDEDALLNGSLKPLTITERVLYLIPLLRYMIPLFVVYYSEYTINSGISPVITFEKGWIPAHDDYKYYVFCYAVGVLISRSSVNIVPVRHIAGLWIISFLQFLTMLFMFADAYFRIVPVVYITFAIIFWEGLLGGACYVNAFYQIQTQVAPRYREFSMGVVSVADSTGICFSALTAIFTESWLREHQHTRDI